MNDDEAWRMGLFIFLSCTFVAAFLGTLVGYIWGRAAERKMWLRDGRGVEA
jgi:membrane protein DedA with SNARE-associated domain